MEDDIQIDLADYQAVLSREGKIDGAVGSCLVSEFFKMIEQEFKQSLQNAQAVLIEFEKNDSLPLSQISSLLVDFHSLIDEKVDIVFGVKQNNSLSLDMIYFKLLITGIKGV